MLSFLFVGAKHTSLSVGIESERRALRKRLMRFQNGRVETGHGPTRWRKDDHLPLRNLFFSRLI